MPRIGRQQSSSSVALAAPALTVPIFEGAAPRPYQADDRLIAAETAPVVAAQPPETSVLLSPSGTFIAANPAASECKTDRQRELALTIHQRIELRLGGRVRNLAVRCVGDTVVLEGQCATYYTKQLAQHSALAVLETEHLENAISVGMP